MPDEFGRFIVGIKLAQENSKWTWRSNWRYREKRQVVHYGFVGIRRETGCKEFGKNRESLEQLKKFSMNMVQFFCVEGYEHGCDERIMEKYVQPYERMLAGDKKALAGVEYDNIPKDNMEEFLTAIGRYKLDMLNDYNPVYDEDLSFCDKIMKDIVYQYVYDSDVYQRMMAGREVAQMQDAECEELKDIAEGQNCQIMQEL